MALLFPVRFPGLARVSVGIGTTDEEIEVLIRTVERIGRKQKKIKSIDWKRNMNDFAREAARKVYDI
jgi:hypothetical protein